MSEMVQNVTTTPQVDRLTFNDGTVVEGNLLESNGILYVYMYGISLKDAFDLQIVPENVSSITWERFGNTGTVTGYEKLFSITEDNGGMVSSAIRRL